MAAASLALRQVIYARLIADAAVVAALGGERVYDDVPVRSEFPYLTFGQITERDWSTSTDEGSEHAITLHVWSRGRGRKETDSVLAVVRAALHDQDLAMSGHRLVNLRHEFSETRRDGDGETFHGIARFRAVTEAV